MWLENLHLASPRVNNLLGNDSYLSASTGDNLEALRDFMAEAARAKWEATHVPGMPAARDDEPDVRFD